MIVESCYFGVSGLRVYVGVCVPFDFADFYGCNLLRLEFAF